jgi:hypothetical protein
MATVDKFVNQISDDMSANEGVNKVKAFDPATILVIISIIQFLIGLWKKWHKSSSQIKSECQNMSLIQKFILRRKITNYMKNHPHQNIYTENKDALVNSSLKVMGRSDEKEIAQLQEEVK